MSNLAYARPLSSPLPEIHPRHIDAVAPRTKARRRPRAAYAVVTVASLAVIFAAQLLLSIAVSDGAYQISGLQVEQKDLVREQEALSEQLNLLGSTQFLAANAANLGMVPNADPRILNLTTGEVASAPGTVDPGGCGGACNLVGNSLTSGLPLVNPVTPPTTTTTPPTQGSTTTTPGTTTTSPGVVDALPAPVTH